MRQTDMIQKWSWGCLTSHAWCIPIAYLTIRAAKSTLISQWRLRTPFIVVQEISSFSNTKSQKKGKKKSAFWMVPKLQQAASFHENRFGPATYTTDNSSSLLASYSNRHPLVACCKPLAQASSGTAHAMALFEIQWCLTSCASRGQIEEREKESLAAGE